ncbi:MAG TPA: pseudouridine synthase [Myxococcales bacterium]|jgi:23S rRNA pseudouridine1911/1915/1917 synthase
MRSRRPPSRLRLVADRDEPLVQLLIRRGAISQELARAATARGGAFVRGRRVRDPESLVRPGDRVEVTLSASEVPALERERILHLDELVLAVDKPAGVAAQEDLAGGPALPELCSALLRETGERQTQALLVHRLDRGTTGVTVLARARRAQAALLAEFRAHRVRKEYRALVAPAPSADDGVADAPVESRPALTRWRVLERFQGAAAVAAMPETGRTHQIRLHMAALGSPLLGDKVHGGAALLTRAGGARHDFSRPMLHALSLELRHPLGGELRVAAPLPEDFRLARDFLAR